MRSDRFKAAAALMVTARTASSGDMAIWSVARAMISGREKVKLLSGLRSTGLGDRKDALLAKDIAEVGQTPFGHLQQDRVAEPVDICISLTR